MSEMPISWYQEKLMEIWKDTLGLSSVSIKDNFFELGGKSIIAVIILTRINETFSIEASPDIFEQPTVEKMAVYISQAVQELKLAQLVTEKTATTHNYIDI